MSQPIEDLLGKYTAVFHDERSVVSGLGSAEISAHKSQYELANGTLGFTVTADSVSGQQGLFSKDASGFGGGGHLTVWLQNGEIVARLQSETGSHELSGGRITAGDSTDVFLTFGTDGFKLYVGGDLADQSSYTGGLRGNAEPIVIGASQWSSTANSANALSHEFKGRIENMALFNEVIAPSEFVGGAGGTTPAPDPEPTPDPDPEGNSAPVASGLLDLTAREGETKKIDLDQYFSDSDGDDLSYRINTNADDFVSLNGSVVTVAPRAGDDGDYTFWVQASDGVETKASWVAFNVADAGASVPTRDPEPTPDPDPEVNFAPVKSGAVDVSVAEGTTLSIDLDQYFSDPDGDQLSYRLNSNDNSDFVRIEGGTLYIEPTNGDDGAYKYWIQASDGEFRSKAMLTEIAVTDAGSVTPPPDLEPTPDPEPEGNSAPVKSGAVDVSVAEGTTMAIDLDQYFSDPDGDQLSYRLNSNDNSDFVRIEGDTLYIEPTNGDDGAYKFWIQASDGEFRSKAMLTEIVVTDAGSVTPPPDPEPAPDPEPTPTPDPDPEVNSAPVKSGAVDVSVAAGSTLAIDLDQYFSDPDGDQLSYRLNSNDNSDFVRIEGDTLYIEPASGDGGTHAFWIQASDGEFRSKAMLTEIVVTGDGSETPAPGPDDGDVGTVMTLTASEEVLEVGKIGAQHWGDGVVLSGTRLDGAAAEVRYSEEFNDKGFGIAGAGSRWDGQIDYYASNGGRSETMTIDFNGDVTDVTIRAGMLGVTEGPTVNRKEMIETGKWTALDADGDVVATGLIGADQSALGSMVKESGSYGVYPIEIDTDVAFEMLVLEATQFGHGEGYSTTMSYGENSSDFALMGVEYMRLEPVDDFLF